MPTDSRLVNFARSPTFDKIALGSCIAYIVLLMCEYRQIPPAIEFAINYLHLFLSILLIIEIGLRGYGLRKEFFGNAWNRYDVVLIILVVIGESFDTNKLFIY